MIYSNYFNIDPQIFFNKKPIDKLSIGQKGTVLLKLFLAGGNYPLIADMPEENLDNKYIYNELVSAFKLAKLKRQIIVATNNANLVINTDSEQIILADFIDNEISYRLGSIEDLSIRDDIKQVLEGGEKALKQRELKLGLR